MTIATWGDLLVKKEYKMTMPILQNRYYTLSVAGTMGRNSVVAMLGNHMVIGRLKNNTITFRITDFTSEDTIVLICPEGGSITHAQLERGNKATDWTPAPEDAVLAQNKKVYNPVRYIRDWLKGSSADTSNRWYEIMANDTNGTNVAQGKTVTTNGTASNLSVITNGLVGGTYSSTGTGKQYVEVDLGSVHYNIASVSIWHYHIDNRTYNETRTEVSEDRINWYPVFDSLTEGTYAETASGKTYPNTRARSEALISAYHMSQQLATSTSQVVINGGNITAGTVKSANSDSWINLDNGQFSFGKGNMVWNGSNLTVKGNIDAASINTGTLATSRIPNLSADKITAGTVKSANSDSWINLDNGQFSFGKGNMVWNGSSLTVKGNIDASSITTGTLAISRVPDLNASKITSGSIDAARIASDTITGTHIAARTITTDRIATNAITANEINVANLSALTANLGDVTAGTIKSTNGLIDIDLNTGVINLGQPLRINTKSVATKEDIDNLEVGGRNLLKNTSETWTDERVSEGAWQTFFYPDFNTEDLGLKVGDVFTAQVELKTTSTNGLRFRIEQFKNSTDRNSIYATEAVVNETKMVTATGTIMADRPTFRICVSTVIAPTTEPFDFQYRKLKLEKGNKATDWTPAPEDVQEQIVAVETRISDAELLISPEAITATVVDSEDLTSKLNGYATQESLGNYISSDDFTTEKENIMGEIDSRIGAIDYSPFVREAELEQKTNAITAKISQAGGVNLIQNSIGWAGKDFWSNFTTISGVSIQNEELASMGFGSGWYSQATGIFTQKQRLTLPRSGTYTLSFWLKKTAGSSWAFVQIQKGDDTTFSSANALAYAGYNGPRLTDGYELFTTTFEATELDVAVSITIDTGVEATITGIMLHEGSEPFKWQPYTSEVYNTNVKMDINGITVKNNQDAGYTLITPDEFSGYAPVDGTVEKVFTLNGDTTEVKKLKAEQQFQMAPVTIITIDNSKYSGWAFI